MYFLQSTQRNITDELPLIKKKNLSFNIMWLCFNPLPLLLVINLQQFLMELTEGNNRVELNITGGGDTVEPCYNEDLGTMKITLLYQVSHYIRVKKQRNIQSWDQQNHLVIRRFCYISDLFITRFHCISFPVSLLSCEIQVSWIIILCSSLHPGCD